MTEMRCLTAQDALDLLGREAFSVVSNIQLARNALVLAPAIAGNQRRIGRRPPQNVRRLPYFAEAMNRWHLSDTARVLWVDHWSNDFPSIHEAFCLIRAGLGESRSLSAVPGHYFGPHPYHERDQTVISAEQARATGVLIGLMSMIMMEGWDGWLLAQGSTDRIEFWEGNIFFYSSETSRLSLADSLLQDFDCDRNLE